MRLVMPLPPNLANSRMQWRVKHHAKNNYWQRCDNVQLLGEFGIFSCPSPPIAPFTKATGAATLYVHQVMDEGNALNRLKWLEDWLVTRGYLEDDKPGCWRWVALPEQQIDRMNPRVEISIAPVVPPVVPFQP